MGFTDLLDVKGIYELVKKGSELEAQQEIMKYRELLLEQSEEILQLRGKLSDLEEKLKIKGNIKKTTEGLFLQDGEKTEGPFCTRCYEVDNLLITLKLIENSQNRYFYCVECHNDYGGTPSSGGSFNIGRG